MKPTRTEGERRAHDASRRQFLQRAATTGAVAAATAAQAVAQTRPAPAARPGAPLKGVDVKFTSGDLTIPAYLSRPQRKASAPGVLVIHEVFGLNDHIKNVADRIAAQGYVALAPQFFARAAEPPPQDATDMQAIRRAASSIKTEDAIKDMQAALDFLKADRGVKKKFASIGFCMGGGWSYQLVTHSKDLAGACVFYGSVPLELVPQVSAPVLASFGEKDGRLNAAVVEPWVAEMKKAGKSVDAKIYAGAGHGFFNDTRPSAYNAEAAADAWQRVLRFFRERLGE
ncbi:MAG TPA: dienelactone hydrolase family protein [Pyrinomonadaceae bacterium]|jgi:carboxymethylenebutenolidase